MKKRIVVIVIIISIFGISIIWAVSPKKINAAKIIHLAQSNYKSITINDKHVETGTRNQYLLDDFIPKLSRYTIKTYDGKLPQNYSYKVNIISKYGLEIILLDNDYLVVDNINYEILDGKINLSKFYSFIE